MEEGSDGPTTSSGAKLQRLLLGGVEAIPIGPAEAETVFFANTQRTEVARHRYTTAGIKPRSG